MQPRHFFALLLAGGSVTGCLNDVVPAPGDPGHPPGSGEPSFSQPPPDGTLPSPVRLAVTPQGNLLVTDSRLGVVTQLDPTNAHPVATALIRGKPLAVGFLDGQVFVGNATAGTIEVLDSRGSVVRSFGRGAVGYPSDLAIDQRLGELFVVDGLARVVRVFDRGGALRRTIGGAATFQAPVGVAVDTARREVLVSDYGDPAASLPAAVRIFGYDGGLVAEISGDAGFSRPQGLAVDGAGRIYLTDAVLGSVLVFDRATLALVKTLGGPDGTPQLRLPSDVVIGANGDLFVTSNLAGRVEVFPREAVVR